LLGELVIVVALLVVYDRVRSLAAVRSVAAEVHGWAILHLESKLHLRIEPSVNSWLTEHGFLRELSVDYYQYMHVSVALGVLVACYLLRPAAYRSARNALVLTNLVGLVVFAFYPAAPPRLLPGAGFVDSVAQAGFGTSHGISHADLYGALPSLHLAWATWVAITGFTLTRRRAGRMLFVAYPMCTAFVVVATANHYVLDVLSGVVLGIAAAWVSGLLPRRVSLAAVLSPSRWEAVSPLPVPPGSAPGAVATQVSEP
jgi:hypothetical protein